MADQLDMNGLNLGASHHAPNGGAPGGGIGRSTYIPPHMRGVPQDAAGPAAPAPAPSMNASAWANAPTP